jgi:predicted anti-sigma-YlaC factor YlaD
MTSVYGPSCDRTRALVSRELDVQLSELERRAVAIHTARCAACRAFERESRWFTEELRDAPLLPLSRPVTITVSARRRLPARTVANLASAAALLAVALGGVQFAAADESSRRQSSSGSSMFDVRFGDPVLREIRREGLRTGEIQVLPVDSPPAKPALSPIDA